MIKKIVSDLSVDLAFQGTNFGSHGKREVIADTLLKIAGGFSTGSTAIRVCQELGLLGKVKKNKNLMPSLTKQGRKYLFYAFAPQRSGETK